MVAVILLAERADWYTTKLADHMHAQRARQQMAWDGKASLAAQPEPNRREAESQPASGPSTAPAVASPADEFCGPHRRVEEEYGWPPEKLHAYRSAAHSASSDCERYC